MIEINALVACHNRRDLTERLIQQLETMAATEDFIVRVFALDDGSQDGTAEMLTSHHIVSSVSLGDGNLFWAKSMSILEEIALEACVNQGPSKENYLLWLNDDVDLMPHALKMAVRWSRAHRQAVFVGATKDDSGLVSYGGLVKNGLHPLNFRRLEVNSQIQPVETFNGNFVLVPVSVALGMRGIDGGFSHGLADIDYGLRLKRTGVEMFLLPDYVGRCNRNPTGTYSSRKEEWLQFLSPKGGGNFRSLKRVLRKQTRFWLLPILASYLLWWARRLRRLQK